MNTVIESGLPSLFYVYDTDNQQFLHSDGVWRDRVINADGVATAYYDTRDVAQKYLDKFKPKTHLADLNPGDKFIILRSNIGKVYIKKHVVNMSGRLPFNEVYYEELNGLVEPHFIYHTDDNPEVRRVS